MSGPDSPVSWGSDSGVRLVVDFWFVALARNKINAMIGIEVFTVFDSSEGMNLVILEYLRIFS
jgi:hypothetical protein